MRRMLSLYASYMLTAIIGMACAALFLAILSAPAPGNYLLAASAVIFLPMLGFGVLFFLWIFPQLVARLNRYEGRENRSTFEVIAEALSRVRPVSRID